MRSRGISQPHVIAGKFVKPRGAPLFVLTAILAMGATPAWSLELAEVLENAIVTPPARVRFREERHNRMLKEALVLTGYLEYLGKGRLRKVIETPFEESFLIDEDQIEIEQNGETRTVALSKSKSLRAMLGGIEAILAGQTDSLEAVFQYTLSGTIDAWALQLKPRSRWLSRHLDGLLVTGDEQSVTSFRFDLKDGEWHLLEILPADTRP